MCYAASCNPECGRCRPKRIVRAACPNCGLAATMGREEYLIYFDLPHRKNVLEQKIIDRGGVSTPTCASCGADLTETFREAVQPAICQPSRVVCGFPCGRKDDPYRPDAGPCPTMVPLGKA